MYVLCEVPKRTFSMNRKLVSKNCDQHECVILIVKDVCTNIETATV